MYKTQNITILGAGIMGLTCAYTLAKNGHTITLHDPAGFPADNASAMAGGMLAPYSEIEHMDMDWVHAGLAGQRLAHLDAASQRPRGERHREHDRAQKSGRRVVRFGARDARKHLGAEYPEGRGRGEDGRELNRQHEAAGAHEHGEQAAKARIDAAALH